jgi:hypothetical protein
MADFFYQLPRFKQHIISLLLLFIVPFILFFNTTIGGKEINRHDIVQWRAGAESIIEYRKQFDEEPLWASNMFGGMPAFVVSTKAQVPHISDVSGYFNNIYPAFQYWVMLTGMYVFLILMGFRPLSAVFGSLTFAITTYFPIIIMAGHTSKFFALAFVPWSFVGYWLLTRSGKKIVGLLVLTTSLALEVRAGHPQITYYFLYLMGIWWMDDSLHWLKQKNFSKVGTITALLILSGIMGIFSNAERILSQQSYAPYSIRGGSDLTGTTGLDTNYAFAWSQGITETLTLIVPNLFGGASPDYWGPKSFTSGPHYLGALAFFFMILGIFKIRDKLLYVFLGVGILAIFFSWGNSFRLLNEFAFNYIPHFDKFRAPETWLVVTSFCFTVVAVFGLDHMFDSISKKPIPIKTFYKSVGTIFAVFIFMFVQVRGFDFVATGEIERLSAQIAQQNQLPANNPQVVQQARNYVNQKIVPEREQKANSDVLRFGLFLLMGAGILYFVSQNKMSSSIAGFCIVTLAGIDMIQVGQRYMDESKFVASNVNSEKLIVAQQRDQDTFIRSKNKEQEFPYRVFPLDIPSGPFSNAIPSYFYPSLGGYSGAKLSLAQEVFMASNSPLFGGDYGINLGLLSALNTKYITYNSGLSIPGLTPVFTGSNGGVVYENDNVLPKAYFADSVITAENPKQAYDLLFAGNLNFYNTAVVENYVPEASIDSSSTVSITNYTGAEMAFDIVRSKTGFLVISEIYYPDGWIALLNGEEIPIHKTNYLLRGVQIPAGSHTLELDFRPSSFYNGVKLSWLSLLFQIGLACFLCAKFIIKKNKGA